MGILPLPMDWAMALALTYLPTLLAQWLRLSCVASDSYLCNRACVSILLSTLARRSPPPHLQLARVETPGSPDITIQLEVTDLLAPEEDRPHHGGSRHRVLVAAGRAC